MLRTRLYEYKVQKWVESEETIRTSLGRVQLKTILTDSPATKRNLHATQEPALGVGRALGLGALGNDNNRTPVQQN